MSATTAPRTMLRLEHVGYTAGGTRILDAATLELSSGMPTAVIGPNGSGKTTLLKIAARLIAPTSGTISLVPDVAVNAFVFQQPVMLRRSAAANLAFALTAAGRRADRSVIASLLDRVGLSALAERPARRLSGGERQRLALARALAREPAVLFLDEPTASLDPHATHMVEEIVTGVAAEGTKVIMATHDLGQARRLAGDVVFLAMGRVVEHTPAADFFLKPRTETARRFLSGELVLST